MNDTKKMEKTININCVIGIDPGANGGIAVFIPGDHPKVVKMPKDVTELADFLQYYAATYKPIVFLEKLSVRPDDVEIMPDGKPNMGKMYRIQKLMGNYEHLKAIIETSGIPYVMVHPMRWMNTLKLRVKGLKEEKAERKRRYAEKAAQLYPTVKITLWNSDAILIMHFGRYMLANEIKWVMANLPQKEQYKLF